MDTMTEQVEQDTAAMNLSDDNATPSPEATTSVQEQAKEEDAAMQVEEDRSTLDEVKSTSSSTDDTNEDSDEDDSSPSPENAEILLLKAANLKEEGNALFKDGDLDKAARSYRRGISSLKKLNQMNTGDEQVRTLLCTLHTNLSTVLYKNGKYQQSADVAGQAIAIISDTVKPYYRRAVALRKLGDWDLARSDLKAALKIDPVHAACVKELQTLKKEMEVLKRTEKQAYAKAFSGGSLYNDKEEAAKRKRREEAEQKKREEELKKQRKQTWEDECVSRMAKGEEAITFEDWDKQRIEQEKKDRDLAEAKKKEEEKRRREARRKQEQEDVVEMDDDDELTPEECKLLRGYKKTADGRTTSYFTRELSAEETNMLGCTAPKRLDDETVSTPTGDNGVASKWNQAGTWEEKDTTAYCKAQLEKRLQEASVTTEDAYDVDITKVKSLNGHSSVAVVAGKTRYIFDFEAELKYIMKKNDSEIATGVVKLPDINSASQDHELDVHYESWKKQPSSEHADKATELRIELTKSLMSQVAMFIQDFNQAY